MSLINHFSSALCLDHACLDVLQTIWVGPQHETHNLTSSGFRPLSLKASEQAQPTVGQSQLGSVSGTSLYPPEHNGQAKLKPTINPFLAVHAPLHP